MIVAGVIVLDVGVLDVAGGVGAGVGAGVAAGVSPLVLGMVLAGAVLAGGVALAVDGLTPRERRAPAPGRLREGLTGGVRRLAVGVAVGLVVLVVTRWVVAGVVCGALVVLWNRLFGGAAEEARAIERLDGLAAWTESLRDTIAGAVGLEQAIPATAYAASPAIARPLRGLADRLAVRTPMPTALRRFAAELDDSGADLVVAALILNSRLRGPGLRDVLSSLAVSIREETEVRRRIGAGRRATRRSVQIVMGVSIAFMVGLAVLNRPYVAPYSSPLGQLVLVVVFLLFAAGFWWLRRLSAYEVPERFLGEEGRT